MKQAPFQGPQCLSSSPASPFFFRGIIDLGSFGAFGAHVSTALALPEARCLKTGWCHPKYILTIMWLVMVNDG